jgi:nucleoside-diphosphate-sugar epimerase
MIVVTGATGFIGHRVAERLLAMGRPVRCPVRSPERARDLASLGAEVCSCDLTGSAGLEDAARGAAAVVHLAGTVRAWRRETFFATNALGTGRLAAAATAAGARKFVLVSSLAASGPGAPGRPVTEDLEPRPMNSYGASKLAAEAELIRAAGSMEWTVVRPCAVYGPRDRDFLALFRLIARLPRVPYAAVRGAELSMVHVDDLADLVIRCIDGAPSGRTYLASDGRGHRWAEIIETFGRALGRKVRGVRIPPRLLWPLAGAAVILRPFRSRPPVLCLDKLREALEPSWTASSERARRELGWETRISLEEGARSTAAWYRENGWL